MLCATRISCDLSVSKVFSWYFSITAFRNSHSSGSVLQRAKALQLYVLLPKQSCLVFPQRVLFRSCSTCFRNDILLKASSERNLFELFPEKQIPAFLSVRY